MCCSRRTNAAVLLSVVLMLGSGTAELRCGIPGRAPNNLFHPTKDSYEVGDSVTYICNDVKYIISAANQRFCRPDGRWLGDIPICYEATSFNRSSLSSSLPRKNAIVDNNHSTCSATSSTHENFVKAKLERPAVLAGIRLVFSPHEQVHIEVAVTKENEEQIKCGTFSGNMGDEHAKDILCRTDGKVESVSVRDIKNNSHYFHLCEIKALLSSESCLVPDVPLKGYGIKRHSNDRLEYSYSCIQGYQLLGSPVVTCVRNGRWTPEIPICAAKCSATVLETIANGELLVNSTTANSVALLSCREGYKPLSDDRVRCLTNGLWSQASLICAPIRCDADPEVVHGIAILLDNSTYYGSRLQVVCRRGYSSREPIIHMCDRSGTWGAIHNACTEISCGWKETEKDNIGQWLPYNESRSMSWGALRVLSCNHGYHIQGFPVVVQCLPNSSWSYSTATCQRTPEAESWASEWTPSDIMLASVAVGAGTAIFILCLVTICLIFKKRHQPKPKSTVFHVGLNDITKTNSVKGSSVPTDENYYTTPSYEEVTAYSTTQPRKPCLALPCPPSDADPVYAQPFETRPRKVTKTNQHDLYATHIYAEPVDSKVVPNSCYSTGEAPNFLKNYKSAPAAGQSSRTVADPECVLWRGSRPESGQIKDHIDTMLRCNVVYLPSGNEDLTQADCVEAVQLIDNDLYDDRYFSNA